MYVSLGFEAAAECPSCSASHAVLRADETLACRSCTKPIDARLGDLVTVTLRGEPIDVRDVAPVSAGEHFEMSTLRGTAFVERPRFSCGEIVTDEQLGRIHKRTTEIRCAHCKATLPARLLPSPTVVEARWALGEAAEATALLASAPGAHRCAGCGAHTDGTTAPCRYCNAVTPPPAGKEKPRSTKRFWVVFRTPS